MSTELILPAGLEVISEQIINHYGVNIESLKTEGSELHYILGDDIVRYSATIERDLGMMRIPFDRMTPGGMVLFQLRTFGKQREASTRYVQVVDGKRQVNPSKLFRKALTPKIKLTKHTQIGAEFDSSVSDIDSASLYEGMVAGALYRNRPDLVETLTREITEKEIDFNSNLFLMLAKTLSVQRKGKLWLDKLSLSNG